MTNLKTRKNNRKLKRRILKILNLFKFKSKNLGIFSKVLFIGVIFSIFSLFLPWILEDSEISYNSFNLIVGLKGYFIFFLDLFILFIIFSDRKKEKFKLNTRFFFKDYYIVILFGILIFVFSLTTYFTVLGLQYFKSASYIFGKGLIFSFISSIIIIFSGILLARKKHNISLVTNESKEKNLNIEDDPRNMKLPFNF